MNTPRLDPPQPAEEAVCWDVPGLGRVAPGGRVMPRFSPWTVGPVPELTSVAEVEEALASIAASVGALRDGLVRLPESEVAGVMRLLGEARTAIEAMTVEVTAEALERNIPSSGEDAQSPVDWVASTNAAYRGVGAAALVKMALVVRRPGNEAVGDAVRSGAVPVAAGLAVIDTAQKVLSSLGSGRGTDDEVRAAVTDTLVAAACTASVRAVRATGVELIATFGDADSLDRLAERAHTRRELTAPRDLGEGIFGYHLRLDASGMARLEAALGPVSGPCPDERGPDPRTNGQRRADGLLTLVDTAVAAPESPSAGMRAQVHVTLPLDALTDALLGRRDGAGTDEPARPLGAPEERSGALMASHPGQHPAQQPAQRSVQPPAPGPGAAFGLGGRVLGHAGAACGSILSPGQVRQLCCTAGIIPLVLGADSVIVDQGQLVRLFPPAMVARIWQRDRHCTFPGCTMPGKWTQAHHLRHWADGGVTAVTNAALLCARHHTVVHARRLHGEVRPHADTGAPQVCWDTRPGSYDRLRE